MQWTRAFFREAAHFFAAVIRPAYRSLRDNKGLAGLSVVLAFGLWIFVTDAENPTRTRVLPLDIPVEAVNVDPNVVVSQLTKIGQNSPATVRVRISVEEDVFESLTTADFEATVDLDGLTVGPYERPVEARPLHTRGGLRVEEVLPEQVAVVLAARESKEVPVVIDVTGEPAKGYTMGAPEAEVTEAVVSGAAEAIALVTRAVGTVSVEGRTDSLDQAVRLEPRDDNGNLVPKPTLEPPVVNVTIEIKQTTYSRPVTVSPDISGEPADGYNIVAVSSNPATVVVRGDQAAIREITAISTHPVDVNGEEDDIVKSVSLRLPQGVSVVGSPNVTVTVRIEAAQGTVRIGVPLTARGLGLGLSVAGDLPTVQVTLKGALPDLLELTSSDVVAFVDLTGKDAGTHSAGVEIALPDGVETTAKTAEPSEVIVALEKS